MRDRGWRTRDFIELTRAEIGIFFHSKLGEDWQRLVAKRVGCLSGAVYAIWPRVEQFRPCPRAVTGRVFMAVEDLARGYGFRSTLEHPALRSCRGITRYYQALGKPCPTPLPGLS